MPRRKPPTPRITLVPWRPEPAPEGPSDPPVEPEGPPLSADARRLLTYKVQRRRRDAKLCGLAVRPSQAQVRRAKATAERRRARERAEARVAASERRASARAAARANLGTQAEHRLWAVRAAVRRDRAADARRAKATRLAVRATVAAARSARTTGVPRAKEERAAAARWRQDLRDACRALADRRRELLLAQRHVAQCLERQVAAGKCVPDADSRHRPNYRRAERSAVAAQRDVRTALDAARARVDLLVFVGASGDGDGDEERPR
jgi:hypothetical protein